MRSRSFNEIGWTNTGAANHRQRTLSLYAVVYGRYRVRVDHGSDGDEIAFARHKRTNARAGVEYHRRVLRSSGDVDHPGHGRGRHTEVRAMVRSQSLEGTMELFRKSGFSAEDVVSFRGGSVSKVLELKGL